jgi:hypothetical protein
MTSMTCGQLNSVRNTESRDHQQNITVNTSIYLFYLMQRHWILKNAETVFYISRNSENTRIWICNTLVLATFLGVSVTWTRKIEDRSITTALQRLAPFPWVKGPESEADLHLELRSEIYWALPPFLLHVSRALCLGREKTLRFVITFRNSRKPL